MYLLDTSYLIDLAREKRAKGGPATELLESLPAAGVNYISTVSMAQFSVGEHLASTVRVDGVRNRNILQTHNPVAIRIAKGRHQFGNAVFVLLPFKRQEKRLVPDGDLVIFQNPLNSIAPSQLTNTSSSVVHSDINC